MTEQQRAGNVKGRPFMCKVLRRVGLENTPEERLPEAGFERCLVKVTWASGRDHHKVGDIVITDLPIRRS